MKKQGAGRRRPGEKGRLALAIVTGINLTLTLILAVMRRQDTLRAIRKDDKVRVLLEDSAITPLESGRKFG